jgi:hypothetical protein
VVKELPTLGPIVFLGPADLGMVSKPPCASCRRRWSWKRDANDVGWVFIAMSRNVTILLHNHAFPIELFVLTRMLREAILALADLSLVMMTTS